MRPGECKDNTYGFVTVVAQSDAGVKSSWTTFDPQGKSSHVNPGMHTVKCSMCVKFSGMYRCACMQTRQ